MIAEDTELYDPKPFFQDFVYPAHPTRFTYEIITHPRNKEFFRQREAAIAKGTYIFRKCRCEWHDPVLRECDSCRNVAALPQLADNNYRIIRCNINRNESSPIKKKNILLTYPDEAFARFIQFEVDRHYPENPTPEDIQRVDSAFREQVNNFKDVMSQLEGDVVWTTSPGNVNPLTGEICHGLYAWLQLDSVEMVSDLRARIKEFKEFHGLDDIECCWDRRNNNTRMPGQTWTQLADSETASMLDPAPIDEPQMSFINFAKAWEALRPISADILFSASKAWFEDKSLGTRDTSRSESVAGNLTDTTALVRPTIQEQVPPCPLFSSTHSITMPHYSVEKAQAEPNTFVRATRRRICSRLARKYRGNKIYLKDAVREGMRELKAISPPTSKTCSDPQLLESTMTRWIKWYFDGFELAKMKSGAWAEKEQRDVDRFRYSSDLNMSIVLPLLKKRCKLTFSELSLVKKIYSYLLKFTGRLAARFIYGDKTSAVFGQTVSRFLSSCCRRTCI